MDFTIFQQIGVAFVLAALIGLEREHVYQTEKYEGFGGIRTFALIGMMGALVQILSKQVEWFLPVITFGFLALVVASYVVVGSRGSKSGATSEVASIMVYIIGILCGMQQYVLATVVALAVLLVLHFKSPLHLLAKHLQNKELVSTIQFMIIAFVVLPLLPNATYGPYGFFNPYVIWLMVVFISGISFASYVAIKIVGHKKGIAFTGFLAGFISSTALAFSFSGESKKHPKIVFPYALAVIVASTAMFFRVLVEILVLNLDLLKAVYLPLLLMGVTGLGFVFYYGTKKEKEVKSIQKEVMEVKSPFNLVPALKFGFFFTLILFLSKFALAVMGDKGVYITSFFSGFLDVDAIVLSMARAVTDKSIAVDSAAIAVTITVMTNTAIKAAILLLFGGRSVALKVLFALFCVLTVGGVSLIFV